MKTAVQPSLKELRKRELLSLRRRGLLKAEDVVEFARDPETALHSAFTWDDAEAAQQYRLWQARQLIVTVTVVPAEGRSPINAYVSLRNDRTNPGGGYRDTVAVMSDAELREQLLANALADFEYWRRKYETLTELAPVFEAAARLRKKSRKAS